MLTNLKVICYNQIVHVGRLKLEEYPSLVEGTGLENQQVGNGAGVRIPFPPPLNIAG